MSTTDVLAIARQRTAAGLSVVPIRTDGTKAPACLEWTSLQDQIANDAALVRYFSRNGVGIGTICGAVSGNLETIDIDEQSMFPEFRAEVEQQAPGLMEKLTIVRTPRGFHLEYRCETIGGNQKLAQRAKVDPLFEKKPTLIETRGEGGYIVSPGSPSACHETGGTYDHLSGPPLTAIARITPDEREILFRVARSFNRFVDESDIVDRPNCNKPCDGLSPGDDYNARATWPEILEPHGWTPLHARGEIKHWRRPGKTDRGWSATTGLRSAAGTELFCVFSSNAHPFDIPAGKTCGTYSKFAAYTFLNHGGDFKTAARALGKQGYGDKPKHRKSAPSKARNRAERPMPDVHLPGGGVTITSAAKNLSALLAQTGEFFVRGGAVVRLEHGEDGQPQLKVVRPAALCSDFERVARLVRTSKTKEDDFKITPANCNEAAAKLILESAAFKSALPTIAVLSRCPVLTERDGELIQVAGYDRQSGILAGGEPVPAMSLVDALEVFNELVGEFQFATPGDRARALVAFITPALVFGGLLGGRAPVDLGEADKSQTGKGFRNKLTAAIYNATQKTVTQRTAGGVGSIQESFDAALVAGAGFVTFDNMRGRIDLPGLESFLTEDRYPARVPYGSPLEIDTRRVVIMLTSNRAEVTIDFANRSSCVRLVKHPYGYQFRNYTDGDLVRHVQADQRRYLGAVFAVVREWYRRGKPELSAVNHDFRRWACVLGYISENILGAGDVLAGHRAAQERIASPGLNWLRDVALAVGRAGQAGQWLRAHQFLHVVLAYGVETPGIDHAVDVDDEAEWLKAVRKIGRKMASLFAGDAVTIDNLRIERHKTLDAEYRQQTEYCVFLGSPEVPKVTPELKPGNPEAPNTPQHFKNGNNVDSTPLLKGYEPIRGLRGTSGEGSTTPTMIEGEA